MSDLRSRLAVFASAFTGVSADMPPPPAATIGFDAAQDAVPDLSNRVIDACVKKQNSYPVKLPETRIASDKDKRDPSVIAYDNGQKATVHIGANIAETVPAEASPYHETVCTPRTVRPLAYAATAYFIEQTLDLLRPDTKPDAPSHNTAELQPVSLSQAAAWLDLDVSRQDRDVLLNSDYLTQFGQACLDTLRATMKGLPSRDPVRSKIKSIVTQAGLPVEILRHADITIAANEPSFAELARDLTGALILGRTGAAQARCRSGREWDGKVQDMLSAPAQS